MNRRSFLSSLAAAYPLAATNDRADPWRTFYLTTHIEILRPAGPTRIWVPLALSSPTPYQRPGRHSVRCEQGKVKITQSKPDGLTILTAEFPAGVKPVLTVDNQVSARDWSTANKPHRTSESDRQHWLRPTMLLPTGGIVQQKALSITAAAKSDTEKARAIYDWIVENTFRKAETRGCGRGDIRYMLESNDLGGKCADLNALYVGLARAAGLPARDAYGIRVAPSRLGYKSLGTSSQNITRSQHCRAEVYLNDHGWTPVDPADVRKVMLEEPPGNRPPDDEKVRAARTRLFGSWEGNWIAYNFAHDVALPGSQGAPLGFFMYPQAETADGRLDCLAPDNFRYEITANEN